MKSRIIGASIFLIIWSLIVDSPFQKGGVEHYLHYVIFLIILVISYLYFSIIENLILAEKIVYSFLFSILSLFIGGLITGKVLDKIYGSDSEMYLSIEIANLIFYFLINLLLIGFTMLFLKYKKY
ncbi:MAG: hypothetical protein K2X95_08745 [Flavobacteriaceae bacterium]|nr:hypothetical protein [Flavobacteriaceae bacterium]